MRIFGTVCFLILLSSFSPLWGQRQGGGNTGGGGTTQPRSTPRQPSSTRRPQTLGENDPFGRRRLQMLILSGRIQTSSGPLTGQVRVEFWSFGQMIRTVFSDLRGNFSISFDESSKMASLAATDASVSSARMSTALGNQTGQSGFGSQGARSLLNGGEIRISAPGFHPISLPTAGRTNDFGLNDLGTITLQRIAKVEGSFLSAVSFAAPKKARKEYAKALKLNKKGKVDEAESRLLSAVEIYPKYATAWNSLGEIYQGKNQIEEASDAYSRALKADPKYTVPYLHLTQLQLAEGRHQAALETLGSLLKLDHTLGVAHYYQAVAHYALTQYGEAEQAIRQGLKSLHTPPTMSHLLLGDLLARKGTFVEAAEELRLFLKAAPNSPNSAQARNLLARLEPHLPKENRIDEPAQ